MRSLTTNVTNQWANVGAFFANFSHVMPILEERGIADARQPGWWLPALTFLAQKDLSEMTSETSPQLSASAFSSFAAFSVFSFLEDSGFQSVEEKYDGIPIVGTAYSRPDGSQREDFVLDGQTVAIRYSDPLDHVSWESITNFYEDGERVRKLTIYDNGVKREDSFVDGVRVTTHQRDDSLSGSAVAWATLESDYDTAGTLQSRTTTYDNGIVREESFTDGNRTTVTQNDDAENAKSWTEITTQYATSGEIKERATIYDNGMERVDYYESGSLSVVLKVDSATDTSNSAFDWSNIIQFHDQQGALVSRGIEFDDGTFRTEDFDAGTRTRILENDYGDLHTWSEIERLFDENGIVSSQRIIDDTLDDTLMFYEAGERSIRIEHDVDQSEVWQFRITEYDQDSGEDSDISTYESLAELPEIYAGYFEVDVIVLA